MLKIFLSKLLCKCGLGPAISVNEWLGNTNAGSILKTYHRQDWPKLNRALDHFANKDLDTYHLCMVAICNTRHASGSLDHWMKAFPNSAHPLISRGAQFIQWAWQARGSGTADTVSEKDFTLFFERLNRAEQILFRALEMNPRNPEPYSLLLTSGNGLQVETQELHRRFAALIERHPQHLVGHNHMLYALTKKWGGSHKEMYEFARGVVNRSPAGSPLASLMAQAHFERWSYLVMFVDNSRKANRFIQSPEVLNELMAAYEHSVANKNYKRTPLEPLYCGMFAAAFYLANRFDLALDAFVKMGDTASEYPWYYLGEGLLDQINTGYGIAQIRRQVQRFVADKLNN